MFKIHNEVTHINGKKGIYDNKIENNTVRYARNAANNYLQTYSTDSFSKSPKMPEKPDFDCDPKDLITNIDKYIKKSTKYIDKLDKQLEKIPAVNFKLKYAKAKNGKFNPVSAVAMAFEELGKNLKISADELTAKMKACVNPDLADLVSSDALDINKDGNIDIGEYAASILVEDMVSTSKTGNLKTSDANGKITNKGQTALLSLANKNNYESALDLFTRVYADFNLKKATDKFIKNPNNLI